MYVLYIHYFVLLLVITLSSRMISPYYRQENVASEFSDFPSVAQWIVVDLGIHKICLTPELRLFSTATIPRCYIINRASQWSTGTKGHVRRVEEPGLEHRLWSLVNSCRSAWKPWCLGVVGWKSEVSEERWKDAQDNLVFFKFAKGRSC